MNGILRTPGTPNRRRAANTMRHNAAREERWRGYALAGHESASDEQEIERSLLYCRRCFIEVFERCAVTAHDSVRWGSEIRRASGDRTDRALNELRKAAAAAPFIVRFARQGPVPTGKPQQCVRSAAVRGGDPKWMSRSFLAAALLSTLRGRTTNRGRSRVCRRSLRPTQRAPQPTYVDSGSV